MYIYMDFCEELYIATCHANKVASLLELIHYQ